MAIVQIIDYTLYDYEIFIFMAVFVLEVNHGIERFKNRRKS